MPVANYVQCGRNLDYTNSGTTDIAYHDVVSLGSRIGIALQPIPAGDMGALSVSDVWEIPADTAAAFAVGDAVYWDTTNAKAVKAAGDGIVLAGYAFQAKAASVTTVIVKIG